MLRNSTMLSEERKVKNSPALHFIKFKIQNSKDMKYQYTVKGVDYEVEIQDIEGNIANVTVNGIPFEVEMKQPVKAGKQKVKLSEERRAEESEERREKNEEFNSLMAKKHMNSSLFVLHSSLNN